MPVVTSPTVVQNAMDTFLAKFFINQPQRDHVANFLTGLMVCPNWLDFCAGGTKQVRVDGRP